MSDNNLESIIEKAVLSAATRSFLREQRMKRLRLLNMTGIAITVRLRYRTLTVEGNWEWIPEEGMIGNWYLAPGELTCPEYKKSPIFASRIRIVAYSAGRRIRDERFKAQDLWLLDTVYLSPIIVPYTHCILRPNQKEPGAISRLARIIWQA